MKKNLFKNAFYALFTFTLIFAVFTSCKKDDPAVAADTTILSVGVDSCQTLLNSSTVTTDYPSTAISDLTTVVNAAKAILASPTSYSQTQVDAMVVQLRTAKATFLAAAYGAIPANALIMGMTFDETVAGNQFTTEGKGWTAVLKQGPSEIFGAATNYPTFATGKIGKAIYFSNGSHLEVSDYAANDLLGSKLSVSVWVKPETTRPGNYIMSYNYWNSWKFQLQEQNKPFFTIHTNADGWVDADNETDLSAPNAQWTHLVVTLDMNTKILDFYVNGTLTKEWDATTKPDLTGSGAWTYKNTLPLMVGACTTYAEANAEWDWSWTRTPEAWDGFVGHMDELKLYNIALTEGQVAKLYKDENK